MGIVGSAWTSQPYQWPEQPPAAGFWSPEQRAGGRTQRATSKWTNYTSSRAVCDNVWYFSCPGRLGQVTASAGAATPLMQKRPCGGAIQHSHSPAAALRGPRPPPQPPAHPSPTSEAPRTWSCFCNGETETFPSSQSSPWPFLFFFFLKKNLCFHCWRKAEPSGHKQASHEQMCSEHPPTQPRNDEPWEGAGGLVSTNSFHTDQWTLAEQKCLFIPSSRGRAPARDPSPPYRTRRERVICDKRLLSLLCFSPWHRTARAMELFQTILKQGPASIFAAASQPCEVWRLLLMVWIVLCSQHGELSKQSPAPEGIR